MKIKNPKGLITGVALMISGIGIMGLSVYGGQMKSIGGGLFLIGIFLTSVFLYHELKK